MPISFPASYDALTNPTSGSLLTSPSHAGQHSDENDAIEAIQQRLGLSGSSFPGSPSTGQFFHHTTRRLNYYYDGTRWLTQVPSDSMPMTSIGTFPLTATGTALLMQAPYAGVYDLWVENAQVSFFVNSGGTALGASHKWVITFVKQNAGTTIATVNIDSGASATWRASGQISIAALFGTTNYEVNVVATKTGTPGDLYFIPSLVYRLVG